MLLAFAAECQRLLDGAMQQSIDISCWQGAQQQTRFKPLLLMIDGQTDGRTDCRHTKARAPTVT